MKTNARIGIWGVALATLTLAACVEQQPTEPPTSPEEVTLVDEWCVDAMCEPVVMEEEDTPEPTEPVEPEEPEEPVEPVEPEEPVMPTEPVPVEPTPEERPNFIDPPDVDRRITLVETHSSYTCAVLDDEVTCWGYNFAGQAQPPEGTYAEHLTLAHDFACAASRASGIVCWGDGAHRVQSIIDDHTIFTRHTISAFDSSARGALCYNADYGGLTGQITCGDHEKQWQVGTTNGFGVSVDHLNTRTSLPIACHIEQKSDTSTFPYDYSYHCTVEGESWEIPVPTSDAEYLLRPQIKVDGLEQTITILDHTGAVHWFSFDWSWTRSNSGIQLDFRPIEVTWEYNDFSTHAHAKLLTPNCVWDGYATFCRSPENELKYIFRHSVLFMAGHRTSRENLHVCFPEGEFDEAYNTYNPARVMCLDLSLLDLYHSSF